MLAPGQGELIHPVPARRDLPRSSLPTKPLAHEFRRPSRTRARRARSFGSFIDPPHLRGANAPRARSSRIFQLNDQESPMKYPSGPPQKLSDRQIREVLIWYQRAENFRRCHGTVRDLAALLSVSAHAIRGVVEPSGDARDIACRRPEHRRGRPRHLNPVQVAFVIAWRKAGRQFRERQGSVAELADKLDVSASTIHDCIRRKGRYTRSDRVSPPTRREGGRTRRLRSEDTIRSKLLRTWRRPSLPP
jgi:transposase